MNLLWKGERHQSLLCEISYQLYHILVGRLQECTDTPSSVLLRAHGLELYARTRFTLTHTPNSRIIKIVAHHRSNTRVPHGQCSHQLG